MRFHLKIGKDRERKKKRQIIIFIVSFIICDAVHFFFESSFISLFCFNFFLHCIFISSSVIFDSFSFAYIPFVLHIYTLCFDLNLFCFLIKLNIFMFVFFLNQFSCSSDCLCLSCVLYKYV